MTSPRRDFLALFGMGAAALAAAPAARADEPAPARRTGRYSDRFPNLRLVTQDGMPVRFYDDLLKDRVAIVNFMYTDCGEGCPLVTANLAELHQMLGPRVGRDILMLSITLTPEMDTPEMLSAYAARFGGLRRGWYYLTGESKGIEKLRRSMGIFDRDPVLDADKSNHAGLITVGNDRTGQWRALPAMLEPRDLAEAILRLARG
jgi:protein SCO1/2